MSDTPANPAEQDPSPEGVTILVCASCRRPGDAAETDRPGAALLGSTVKAAGPDGIAVRRAGCLGNCGRGLTAAIYRTGCWTYVFGGLGPDSAEDLVAGALLLAGARDGFMPFRARPEALRTGLIARIPRPEMLDDF